jgi:hypothetical protein
MQMATLKCLVANCFSEATHVKTRLAPNQASSEISGRALFRALEIDGTRAKERLFRLTPGHSVQRFGAILNAGRESCQSWRSSTGEQFDEHCTAVVIWRSSVCCLGIERLDSYLV